MIEDGNKPKLSNSVQAEEQIDEALKVFDFSNYPLPKTTRDTFRIFYNNVNGLEINKAVDTVINNRKKKSQHSFINDLENHTKIEAFIKQMYSWQVHASVLSEPCIEWRDSIPRKVVKDISKKYDKLANWTVATSKCYSGSFVKPGGALIYSNGEIAGRITERGTDPWGYGRWSFVRYQGKAGKSLLVVGAYRVGHRTGIAGASTAWYQQKVLLTQEGREIEPEDAFIEDLVTWYTNKVTKDTETIVMLDANEQWTEHSSIRSLAQRLHLENLNTAGGYGFPATHPCIANPTRDTTIDFCLCSPKILQNIQYATMVPFDLTCLGDHRGILIDLDLRKLLKVRGDEDNKFAGRKLSTTNPAMTKKYLEKVEEMFTKQNISTRANKLFYNWTNKKKSKWDTMKKYEKLDKEIFHICRKAEQLCRPNVSGRHKWSPKLVLAIKTLSYWRARRKYGQNNAVVQHLGKEAKIEYEYQSNAEIISHIDNSRENLTIIQQESIKHRQQHLQDLADKYAKENNISRSTAVTELMSQESAKSMFALLREKLKKASTRQLQKIWISYDENGRYKKDPNNKVEINSSTKAHKLLLQRNQQHLGQAKNTPFASGEWKKKLKWDGTGNIGRDILSGDILNQQKFNSTVQLYFESLATTRFKGKLNAIKAKLSLEEYRKFWKKKREETVTSPFGLHVGHFKAAIQHDGILNVHRLMLLIPFQTALVPYRWKKTVQTMLEKDPGQPWIHRLRIIELFDSQVNAGFQIFIGRKMVWEAVRRNQLHPASYGSTPGKMAASAVLQKVLSVDQMRIERRAGGLFDCDATGCYDRILPPLAVLHLQALGLSTSIAVMLARLMFVAKRHVKTQHGVSKDSIQTNNANPLFGIGQGNGGGPAIWLSHLTVMFTALSAICTGFKATCIKGIEWITTVGTGYVDDVTLMTTVDFDEPQTEHRVKAKIYKMANRWEKLLYLTGGKLELSKCFWIPVTWKWKHGNPIMTSGTGMHTNLVLTESESGQKINIPRVTPASAEKRLGIQYSLNGKWTNEFSQWKQYTMEYVEKLKISRLDRIGGAYAYTAIWCAKFRFCAPVISFTNSQLTTIQRLIIGTSLSLAGYNSKMPRDVVFGPMLYGGMQWESPLGISLYEQVKIFIGSIRLNDEVGKILRMQTQWLQVSSGTSRPILEETKAIPYLQHCWITSLHNKLVDHGIKVQIYKTWIPKERRENDKVIMDYVRKHLPQDYWGPVNQCRLFLKAITFADVVTFDGTKILEGIYEVQKSRRSSRILFPRQLRPPKKSRLKWQYFIDHIANTEGFLWVPLGGWIRKPYQYYKFVVENTGQFIFSSQGKRTWKVFQKQQGTRNTFIPLKITANKLPKHWTPIHAIKMSNSTLRGILPDKRLSEVTGVGSKEFAFFEECYKKQVVGNFEINVQELQELSNIWNSQEVGLLGGSDGGLKDALGTSGYVIYRQNSDIPLVRGFTAETQVMPNPSSTRQELLGQLGVVYWIERLVEYLGSPQKTVEIRLITDSKASISIMENVQTILGIKDVMRPDIDVALELHRNRKKNPNVHVELYKVQSHISIEEAPNEKYWQLNDEADTLATTARIEVTEGRMKASTPVLFPGSRVSCTINGNLVTSALKTSIAVQIYRVSMREYLLHRYDWNLQTFEMIDWIAHRDALREIQNLPRITVMKYIHGWLATSKRQWKEGRVSTPQCLLCDTNEDRQHLFCCQHEGIRTQRTVEIIKLQDELLKITDPEVVHAMMAGIGSVTGRYTMELYQQEFARTKELATAVKEQTTIGWTHFLYGRITKSWQSIGPNERYRDMPTVWAKIVVGVLFKLGVDLWKHRNLTIHGGGHGISKLELSRTAVLIQLLYKELVPVIDPNHRWLFHEQLDTKLGEMYPIQLAWLDSVRRLYPKQYEQQRAKVGTVQFQSDLLEYMKDSRAGWVMR